MDNVSNTSRSSEPRDITTKQSLLGLLSVSVKEAKWQVITISLLAAGFILVLIGGVLLYLGVVAMIISVIVAIVFGIRLRLQSIEYEAHLYSSILSKIFPFMIPKDQLEHSSVSSFKNYLIFVYVLGYICFIIFLLYQIFVRL